MSNGNLNAFLNYQKLCTTAQWALLIYFMLLRDQIWKWPIGLDMKNYQKIHKRSGGGVQGAKMYSGSKRMAPFFPISS